MTAYPWTIKICSKCRRDAQAADMVKVKTQSGIVRLYCPDCAKKRQAMSSTRHA